MYLLSAVLLLQHAIIKSLASVCLKWLLQSSFVRFWMKFCTVDRSNEALINGQSTMTPSPTVPHFYPTLIIHGFCCSKFAENTRTVQVSKTFLGVSGKGNE